MNRTVGILGAACSLALGALLIALGESNSGIRIAGLFFVLSSVGLVVVPIMKLSPGTAKTPMSNLAKSTVWIFVAALLVSIVVGAGIVLSGAWKTYIGSRALMVLTGASLAIVCGLAVSAAAKGKEPPN